MMMFIFQSRHTNRSQEQSLKYAIEIGNIMDLVSPRKTTLYTKSCLDFLFFPVSLKYLQQIHLLIQHDALMKNALQTASFMAFFNLR